MIKAAADASERFLLVLVLVIAAAGVAGPAPGRALAAGNGIDAALVEIHGSGIKTRFQLLAFKTYPYPRGFRQIRPWIVSFG